MGSYDNRYEAQTTKASPAVADTAQPVDHLLTRTMEAIHRRGRGFTLDLAKDATNDKHVVIEVREQPPVRQLWAPPAKNRAHLVHDMESFIDYVKRYGNDERSLVLHNAGGCVLVVNELEGETDRELIRFPYEHTQEWKAWDALLSMAKPIGHKSLVKFLRSQEHNLEDVGLLLAVQTLKMNSTVNTESEVREDGQSFGVMIKTNAGEEFKKFPKSFGVAIPVYEHDEEPMRLMVRVEPELPDDPREGVTFSLRCPERVRQLRQRVGEYGNTLTEELDGWAVIHGTLGYVDSGVEVYSPIHD